MAKIKVPTTVLNAGVIDDIEDDIESGVRKAAREIGEATEEVAEERIRSVGAVFTGDLVNSFDVDVTKVGGNMVVRITNDSDHAAAIEYGASYTDSGPPLAALIPWVKLKMRGFTVPEDDVDLPRRDTVRQEADTEIHEPDGTTTDLLDVVSDSVLKKAFWLQQHIKEEGIDAVRYMALAEEFAVESGPDIVATEISKELRS